MNVNQTGASGPLDSFRQAAYEAAKQRLIDQVRPMVAVVNFTDQRAYMADLAGRLSELADELDEQVPGLFDLEEEHDKPQDRETGPDGMPVMWPDFRCSFKGTLTYMRDLADSARRVAGSYPEPRKRLALPHAAAGYVWLRHEFGLRMPSLYNDGEDLREFSDLCTAAGIHRAPETLRNAMSQALKDWESDPHMQPGWVHYVLTGSP